MSSFVSHSSLLTAKSIDLAVACDGSPSKQKSSIFFIVATLIVEVLFVVIERFSQSSFND